MLASSAVKTENKPQRDLSLEVPDWGCRPEPPQRASLKDREQHGVDDDEAGRPVVDGQPVPCKLCNQLVWKNQVFHQKLCPLLPAGLQLTETGIWRVTFYMATLSRTLVSRFD